MSPSTELTGILNFHLNNDICTIYEFFCIIYFQKNFTDQLASDLHISVYLNPASLNVFQLSGTGPRANLALLSKIPIFKKYSIHLLFFLTLHTVECDYDMGHVAHDTCLMTGDA